MVSHMAQKAIETKCTNRDVIFHFHEQAKLSHVLVIVMLSCFVEYLESIYEWSILFFSSGQMENVRCWHQAGMLRVDYW